MGVLASSLDRIATEIRHLQRTDVREVEEPFKSGQKGSSSMPHKRNPVRPHRSHLYQRLVFLGLSHKGITLRYGAAMLLCSVTGFFLQFGSVVAGQILLGIIIVLSAYYTIRIVRQVRASQTLEDRSPG